MRVTGFSPGEDWEDELEEAATLIPRGGGRVIQALREAAKLAA